MQIQRFLRIRSYFLKTNLKLDQLTSFISQAAAKRNFIYNPNWDFQISSYFQNLNLKLYTITAQKEY